MKRKGLYTNTQPFLPDAFIFIFSIFQFIINHLAINFWKYGCIAINITAIYTYTRNRSHVINQQKEQPIKYVAIIMLHAGLDTHISVFVCIRRFQFLNTTTTTFYG